MSVTRALRRLCHVCQLVDPDVPPDEAELYDSAKLEVALEETTRELDRIVAEKVPVFVVVCLRS